VIVPGADRDLVEQMKAMITRLGSLEFGILANDLDHKLLIDPAKQIPDDRRELFAEGRVVAAWRDAAEGKETDTTRVASRVVKKRGKEGQEVDVLQFLVVQDRADRAVTGKYLTASRAQTDNNGRPAVGFYFNARGAVLFNALTGANLPEAENGPNNGFARRLAILLDGKVYSAPTIQSRISSAGEITGNFTMKEVNELVAVLNAGALEVPLIQQPISEFTISALLGADVKQKGMMAIAFSAFVVFAFMLIYYRVSGVIADLSLALNLLMVVGSMALIAATFTLPGLAGIVLTIGMAVDSNVLIYERMREELARGASLRVSIQNGFDKAFSAIFDGNVSSLLTAVILYMIGSDLIRGFAVTLFLGLLMSLFSCLYFGHLAFDIIERKRLVKTLTMMQFIGETRIDFLAKRGIAFAVSGLVIAAGFAALLVRGSDNMDIDFSGGQMITFEFVKEQTTVDVRSRLEGVFPGVSLEQLTLGGEQPSAEGGRRFRMRTTEQNPVTLIEGMNKAFADADHALIRVTLADFQVNPITEKLEGEAERFAGGHQVALKFNGEISEATVLEYVARELSAVKLDANQSKYESVQLLLEATGTVAAPGDVAPDAAKAKVNHNPKFAEFTLRSAREIDPADLGSALKAVQTRLASSPVFEEVNAFDTSVANDTKIQALLAILASLVMIVAYIWIRFEKVYFGYAAVVALAHDVLVTLGCIALGGYLSKTPIGPLLLLDDFKINLNQIACLLTIVGYSLNDTIVIFDRIREIKGKSPRITPEMINQSVNQTLSRTLLTALSTFMVVIVLYIAGGEGIHGFAFSMIVGVITGCYSTIYIANPVLLWLVQREEFLAKQALAKR
ncbi:MAG: protein translocase subunit SecD, partial [Candidatus Saccharimonas sp.]|nr:protein translocase subunit SecD [Planctomycetaceae bacterium]